MTTDFAFGPTDEQIAALDQFRKGDSMVIEARAGSGKTTTLILLAQAAKGRGRYTAFNRAIVNDVHGKLPPNVDASTAHSLAFRAVGKRYDHRLQSPRMRSWEIAQILGVRHFTARYGTQHKTLSDQYLGGLVMRSISRFCQTADDQPGREHVPYVEGIDPPDDHGQRTYTNNDELRAFLAPALDQAWADITDTEGRLKFEHGHYLKMWQLSHPTIAADFVLFDECQDASPVMAAVIAEQDHAQLIWVGDSCQAIYGFTGAVNMINKLKADGYAHASLSQSFRFGDAIAVVANVELAKLDADPLVRGLESIDSVVGPLDGSPDAVLCRTNAAAVHAVLEAQREGRRAHLVGGGNEVTSFARAAQDLMDGKSVWHPDLACFESWGEVRDYVRDDAQGHELRLLVRLVDDFGVPTILRALERMPAEDRADLIVSTAHKSKGREWKQVRIDADFADVEQSDPEIMLRYVAFTRARLHLDMTGLQKAETEAAARKAAKDRLLADLDAEFDGEGDGG